MLKGIVFALIAGAIWGMTFVVPEFMGNLTAMEVTVGRYVLFGLFSSAFFLKTWIQKKTSYPKRVWLSALSIAFFSSIGYYTFFILSIRYSTPAICALILGMSPITIAFYGNLKERSVPFRSLLIPSLLIFVGLIIINAPHFTTSAAPDLFMLGLLYGFLSLITWSLYTVTNGRFLKENPEISPVDWSNIVGVATLIWALIFAVALILFFPQEFRIEKCSPFNPDFPTFIIGSAILGIICSWVAIYYWNKASFYLPVTLAGQMMISPTIFGVLFAYILEKNIPPPMEILGIGLLLFAISYGIRQFSRGKPSPSISTE